jgi:hypothetical protein
MSAHKIAVGVVAIAAAAVAGAVARSSTDANISTFPKTHALAAACPKIDWPYGCQWRPTVGLTKKKSLLPSASSRRSNALRRLSRFRVGL